MKNAIFAVLAIGILFVSCSGNEQRIVGTWTNMHDNGIPFVFNSNGTMSVEGMTFDGFVPTHYAAAGDRLLLFIPGADWDMYRAIRYFHISSDGRTLIISTTAVAGASGSIGTALRRN
jgi:hypothetical protein